MRRRSRGQRDTQVELNITSFMSLMVILIPFLLLNAVFVQVSIVSVDQPSNAAGEIQTPPDFVLDILLHPERIVVKNRSNNTQLAEFNTLDYAQLNQLMRELKTQHPTVSSATLNVDDRVSYQQIINTMDAVRIVRSTQTEAKYPLFPELQLTALEAGQ
ncbi:MAG: biopolymer transporter ExbD [Pseudomonadota bacterium]|nr:biopolymer transporter ExbD [Pseudomonadota bacterium]